MVLFLRLLFLSFMLCYPHSRTKFSVDSSSEHESKNRRASQNANEYHLTQAFAHVQPIYLLYPDGGRCKLRLNCGFRLEYLEMYFGSQVSGFITCNKLLAMEEVYFWRASRSKSTRSE
jgi:hypothetical protein